jgi:colanic acid biosynthesis glycosyl transferase WcaI
MAAGRPFVTTARPGSPLWDMASDSGAFVCVPPYDTDSFADAVLRLARDEPLRRALGDLGRQFVEQKYSKEAVTRQLLRHLESPA